jgi:hypothetical protein
MCPKGGVRLVSVPLPFPVAVETTGMRSLNRNTFLLPLFFSLPVPHEKQNTEIIHEFRAKAYPLYYGTWPII